MIGEILPSLHTEEWPLEYVARYVAGDDPALHYALRSPVADWYSLARS